jgi:hypothetical protein
MPHCRPLLHVTRPVVSTLHVLTSQLPADHLALLTVIWVACVPTMKLAASAAGL